MVSSRNKSIFIVMFLVLLLTLSSFAFAKTTLFDKDNSAIDKDAKIKDKYDYATVDAIGDVYYKNNKVKYITDLDLNTFKIKQAKGSLEFLDLTDIPFNSADYHIKEKLISFDSDKYKLKNANKLTDFMNPVITGNETLSVAKLTFQLDDSLLLDNETSIAMIYKYDGFTDDYDYAVANGELVDIVEFSGDSIEYYADSFSTFVVVSLTTNSAYDVDHSGIRFVPQYTAEITNPDSLTYSTLTQIKQVLDANYQTIASFDQSAPLSLATRLLSWTDLPETHVQYRYRIAFLQGTTLYTTASQPTFGVGIVISNDESNTITSTSATLVGQNWDSLNGYSTLSCGFNYRESGTSTWSSTGETTISSAYATWSATLTGLDPETEYEWRSMCWDARNGIYVPAGGNMNDWYSFTETFTTPSGTPVTPNVDTDSATSIGDTTATLNADITTLGSETSVTGYFRYREVGTTTYTKTADQTLTTTGAYTQALTGLTACTNYEYYAELEYPTLQYDYGTTTSFITTGCSGGGSGDIVGYWSLMDSYALGIADQISTNDLLASGGIGYDSGDDSFGFDGSNDYLYTPATNTVLGSNPDSWSYGIWIKSSSTNDQHIMSNYETVGTAHTGLMRFDSAGKINIDVYDGSSGTNAITTNSYNDGNYHFVVATFSKTDNEIKLYVDGLLKDSDTMPSTTSDYTTTNPIWLGTYNSGAGAFFTGSLSGVLIFDTTLTPTQVSDIYADGRINTPPIPTPSFLPPAITIGTPTIYSNSLLITSSLVNLGNATTVDVGYLLSGNGLTNESVCTQTLTAIGDFSCNVVLEYGTEYDVVAFATYTDDESTELTVYTESQTFTTDTATAPTLETAEVQSNTGTTLTFVGTVNTMGSYSELRCYNEIRETGSTDVWTLSSNYATVLSSYTIPYDFTNSFIGLSLDTGYDYRAVCFYDDTFSSNITGTTSNVTTLTTSIIEPTITSVSSSNIGLTSATLTGIIDTLDDTETNYNLLFRYRKVNFTTWIQAGSVAVATALDTPYSYDYDLTGLTENTDYEFEFMFRYYETNSSTQTTMISDTYYFSTNDPDALVSEETVNDFFDNFTAGNKTLKFIVALVLIIGMFIMGFQLTNTVVGGGVFAGFGLILSVVLGLIGIGTLILILLMLIAPFLLKLMFRGN